MGSLLVRALGERVDRSERLAAPRKAPQRLSAEMNAAIVAEYQSGMKASDVARKHGINEWTVRHRLRRSGIPLRPISMSGEEVALTLALRAQGLSYVRIAARVGFSEGTVRNVLKRHQS